MLAEIPTEVQDAGTTYDTTGADLLVAQKDELLGMLNAKQYETVLVILESCENLWRANRYQYKLRELTYRIGFELSGLKAELAPNARRQRERMDALIVRADAIHNRNHAR